MIAKWIATIALVLLASGCAGGGTWDRGENPVSGGAPASWPCQASG